MELRSEFPREMLALLRCSRDAGELILGIDARGSAVGVTDGTLRCVECSQEYSIEGGIARLMQNTLTQETRHEIALKGVEYEALPDTFEAPSSGWRSKFADYIEVPPHLEELAPLEGRKVLELACGDGRFTILMAQLGAQVLAVDFSFEALRKLARRLPSGIAPTSYEVIPREQVKDLSGRVGLVQADAGYFNAAPRSFDRALSASPLDSRDERMNMYRTVAVALTDQGRYVAGVEHDDMIRRLLGLPPMKRYTPGGIFVDHLSIPQMRSESAPYYSRLRFRLIRAHVPFTKRLPTMLRVRIARTVTTIPVLRQMGELILLTAEAPIRPPLEGVRRPGSSVVKTLYRWYKRLKKEQPIWDPGELV
jgi:SAM-dependent methyltransferase/uncharacterized protein YbaR (Trm112 family)